MDLRLVPGAGEGGGEGSGGLESEAVEVAEEGLVVAGIAEGERVVDDGGAAGAGGGDGQGVVAGGLDGGVEIEIEIGSQGVQGGEKRGDFGVVGITCGLG